jgi:hypothetical protein
MDKVQKYNSFKEYKESNAKRWKIEEKKETILTKSKEKKRKMKMNKTRRKTKEAAPSSRCRKGVSYAARWDVPV